MGPLARLPDLQWRLRALGGQCGHQNMHPLVGVMVLSHVCIRAYLNHGVMQ